MWGKERKLPCLTEPLGDFMYLKHLHILRKDMREVKATELSDNFFKIIGKDWMLLSAGKPEAFNTMTASWGGVGYLWNQPVAFVFVRPERYTYEFMEANSHFTLSFLEEAHRNAHKICGFHSGRDMDKAKAAGLTIANHADGNLIFDQARMTLGCRKLYSDMLDAGNFIERELTERWYGSKGGYHRMYIGGIEHVWLRD